MNQQMDPWWGCPRCGAVNASSAGACAQCGTGRGTAPAPAPPTRPSRRGLLVATAAVTATVALIAGAVALTAVLAPSPDDSIATLGSRSTRGVEVPTDVLLARPTDPGRVVDLPTATAVVKAFWPVYGRAAAADDAATLEQIEAGPALAWDAMPCATGCDSHEGGIGTDVVISAPPQSTYPARFLAQVRHLAHGVVGGAPIDELVTTLLVFERVDASAPWKAVINVSSLGATETVDPDVPDPTAAVIPSVIGDLDPHDLPARLAEYFQSWKDTGAAPADTPFSDSGAPLERGQTAHRGHQRLVAQGASDETTYRSGVADDGYYEFAGRPGHIVACSTVRWDTAVVAGAGRPVEQPSDRSLYGPAVPAGRYASLQLRGVRQACFSMPTTCRCVQVRGMSGGIVAADTVRSGG